MELMDIIQLALTSFGVFTLVVVIMSYIIYKMKDKERVKPYANIQPAAVPAASVKVENKNKIVNNVQPKIIKVVEQPIASTNFYDNYSNRNAVPMHKLKFKSLQN